MGTRSLLGYVTKNGQIYAQYMQFDGSPRWNGREFYESVVRSMNESALFVAKTSGQPTEEFFLRVRRFLDNYQYKTGHSVNNHMQVRIGKYLSGHDIADSEWRYLFKRNGDFIIYKPGCYTVTISWSFTTKMIDAVGSEFDYILRKDKPGFGEFWEQISNLEELKEHKKIVDWAGEQALLHMKDDFDYRSSKIVLEQVLKGDPPVITYPPVLSLEYGQVQAFPNQSTPLQPDGGWRNYGTLRLNGKTILKGMFSRNDGIKRNKSVETIEPHGNV